MKNIEVGEEVCVSYINPNEEYKLRKMNLFMYSFECQCPKCYEYYKKEKDAAISSTSSSISSSILVCASCESKGNEFYFNNLIIYIF